MKGIIGAEKDFNKKIIQLIRILCIAKNVKWGELEEFLGYAKGNFSKETSKFSLYDVFKTCEKLDIDVFELLKFISNDDFYNAV